MLGVVQTYWRLYERYDNSLIGVATILTLVPFANMASEPLLLVVLNREQKKPISSPV